MDFFKNRSIVLEYYPVTLSVIFIISVFFIFSKKKNQIKKVITEVESVEGINKYSSFPKVPKNLSLNNYRIFYRISKQRTSTIS